MGELFQYRDLVRSLIVRDLTVRYRRSAIGFLWTMLHPLMMMLVLEVVFSTLFRFTLKDYPVYVFSGILFWNFFSQSVISSMNSAVLYQNKGAGKWERRQPPHQPQVFGDSLVLGDFGHLDFATSTGVMGQRALVNLWKPDGTWEPVTVNELRPEAYVWSVAAADFDGSGRADLAVAYSSFEGATWRSGIDVLFPRADGHWDRRPLGVGKDRQGPVALATGNLEGNGHQDLAALTADGETWIFLGDGRGSFTREKTPPPTYPGACRGSHVELADLDGDGKAELIASFADEPETEGHCPPLGGITAWKVQAR